MILSKSDSASASRWRGSAGRRRFSLPISVGELLVDGERVEVRLVTLDVT